MTPALDMFIVYEAHGLGNTIIKLCNECWRRLYRRVRYNSEKAMAPLFSALEKAMTTHSNTLAWKIPRTAAYQAPPSMGLLRVGHD